MTPLRQSHIDWLIANGVTVSAMIHPTAILWSSDHNVFWFPDELVSWNPDTGLLSGWWCLGDDLSGRDFMTDDWTLTIHATPLDWLRAGRDGIVVIDWSRLFDYCRDIPRISIPPSLKDKYQRYMRPNRLPKLVTRAAPARPHVPATTQTRAGGAP